MGYISEVKSLISELTQYNVSPEKLDTFLETEDVGETLRLKMQDISVMYHSFSEYLQGQYITSEEVLSLLCDAAEDSNIIKDSVIVFDEFTGFTPIQNQLLRKLLVLSERIIVSVTMDAGEDFYHCRGEQELFSMSKKTVSVLLPEGTIPRKFCSDTFVIKITDIKMLHPCTSWSRICFDRIIINGGRRRMNCGS